jgi:flagellar biosynthetic protein FliR
MTLWDFIKPEHIVELLLIMVRVGGVFMASPLLGNHALPRQVKVVVVIMISLLLAPVVHAPRLAGPVNEMALIIMILSELTIGIVLGFSANIIFLAVQSAGEFFGGQVGFSIATIIDPANEGSSGVLASLYVMIGALIFLYLNGHHVILSTLAHSFRVLPLSQGFEMNFAYSVTQLVAYLFMTAIQLSAPVIVVLTVHQPSY